MSSLSFVGASSLLPCILAYSIELKKQKYHNKHVKKSNVNYKVWWADL